MNLRQPFFGFLETGGRQPESNLPGNGCRPQPGLKPGRATGRDCLPLTHWASAWASALSGRIWRDSPMRRVRPTRSKYSRY